MAPPAQSVTLDPRVSAVEAEANTSPPWPEHKTKPQDHTADSTSGQEGSGRQHPTGSGSAHEEPAERGSAGGKTGGKKDRHQGP
jgi:hypothetical protein